MTIFEKKENKNKNKLKANTKKKKKCTRKINSATTYLTKKVLRWFRILKNMRLKHKHNSKVMT